MERILEINALEEVTKQVVEAARESLVIGQAEPLDARGLGPRTSLYCIGIFTDGPTIQAALN